MAIGTLRRWLLGSAGYLAGQKQGMWDFVYDTSTTKDSRYNIGDEVSLPGNRVAVYSKSTTALDSGMGCKFTGTGVNSIATITTAAAVGARSVVFPASAHDTVTADSLRGGFCTIFDGTTNRVQFRCILGNTAALTSVAFTIYLDGPLKEAVTTSSKIEVFANPFGALSNANNDDLPVAGRPASYVSAANMYFWCIVEGFGWVAPQSNVGITSLNGPIAIGWQSDGSVQNYATCLGATVAAYSTSQYAGHLVAGTAAGNGPLAHFVR